MAGTPQQLASDPAFVESFLGGGGSPQIAAKS
jgi:hypothetical protein